MGHSKDAIDQIGTTYCWLYVCKNSVWKIHMDSDIWPINTLRPRQNGRHLADAIFKCILLNENVWIPNKIFPEVFS